MSYMSDKIFICRCEDLSQDEIEKAIDQGYATLEELKCKLRLGMGPCQGRGCYNLVIKIIETRTGNKIEKYSLPIHRPPIIPISLGTLASD